MNKSVESEKIPLINRKLWVALANDQLRRRQRYLGKAIVYDSSAREAEI